MKKMGTDLPNSQLMIIDARKYERERLMKKGISLHFISAGNDS